MPARFEKIRKSIAKELVGQKVPRKFRKKYGKRYTQKTAKRAAYPMALVTYRKWKAGTVGNHRRKSSHRRKR
jgi:hypothetical protein